MYGLEVLGDELRDLGAEGHDLPSVRGDVHQRCLDLVTLGLEHQLGEAVDVVGVVAGDLGVLDLPHLGGDGRVGLPGGQGRGLTFPSLDHHEPVDDAAEEVELGLGAGTAFSDDIVQFGGLDGPAGGLRGLLHVGILRLGRFPGFPNLKSVFVKVTRIF